MLFSLYYLGKERKEKRKKEKKELPSAPSQGKPINPAARTACRTH
jgi:hypothetical protein